MKDLTFNDIFTKADMKEVSEDWLKQQIKDVKDGKIIKAGYALSTAKKRSRFGLQTGHVDLYGNDAYSNKDWRLLDEASIEANDNRNATVKWSKPEAQTQYGYLVDHYGKIL